MGTSEVAGDGSEPNRDVQAGASDAEDVVRLEPVEVVGGSVDSLVNLPGGPDFRPEEHRAMTARGIAIALFCALSFCFVLHVTLIYTLSHDKATAVDEVSRVFNQWIPIFSGLFGSAVTYYFTGKR